MTQVRLLLVLVRPSLLSFAATLLVTAGIIGATNWAYLAANPWFFEAMYGERGIITTLERSPNEVGGLQESLATNPTIYYVGVGVLAIIAALAVFVGLRSVEHGVGALAHLRRESAQEKTEQRQRGFARLLIGTVWALYILFTFNFIVPFCILLWRIGAEGSDSQALFISTIAGFLLFAALHLHVIFARLFMLRPRVFGGEATVESALIHTH